ncbi:MAG: F0F1 ATP synthase subunit B [Actinomycetes bacterium]|jgi:F-type H+-transporting ATPase subunit b
MNTHFLNIAIFKGALRAEDAAGPSPVIPKPAEIVVGLIAFSILFILLRTKAVPRFEKAFSTRVEAIQGGIEKAERAQAEAAKALESYKVQLSDAGSEAQKIREEARIQGTAIIEDLRARAQEEAARITANAHASIEAERQAAITSLRLEVGALATTLASKIVGEALEDQARQSRVVDRFLEELKTSGVKEQSK